MTYFLTFTTYGTRLHGDERGSVHHSRSEPGTPRLEAVPALQQANEARLVNAAQLLDNGRRRAALTTITRVCELRGWELLAANVRTNHIHAVVAAPVKPELVLNELKVWISRDLKEAGRSGPEERMWTRHGSPRYLWKEREVRAACSYVLEEQGVNFAGAVWPREA